MYILDILTMLFLGMTQCLTLSHSVISMLYAQAHYPSSYSNLSGLPVLKVFQLPSSSEAYPTMVRAAAKISAGGVGSP